MTKTKTELFEILRKAPIGGNTRTQRLGISVVSMVYVRGGAA